MRSLDAVARHMSAIEGLVVRTDEPLSRHTSFCLGGPARVWVAPSSVEQLQQVARAVPKDAWAIIGAGTNVLCDDSGFEGVVVCTRSLRGSSVEGREVRALAGTVLTDVIRLSVEGGLSGLERLWGIPGTVGGAIAGNAGAFGAETFDCLQRVTLIARGGALVPQEVGDLTFGYRSGGVPAGHAIVEATWRLEPGDVGAMRAAMDSIRERRSATQPWSQPTAGCVFRNPKGDSAGRLIDHAGLKGARVGGAVVSALHGNFIVLDGPACASDVRELIRYVRERVRDVTGVSLETELKMIGSDA
ncbi:UDP-N-acetylmuramate dehydrogenase [Candidatus Fermentibacteria bacterium]|nr:UDP-N-acetylmuramate dehydrogenase [Candidatus Fermentibacteria bacterium]